ncbi:hypothetical protein K501DRAFT_265247 [Backusella circina FSU 941]|nr:hypothetical protein K501DRAFT_265247 [Backusella circina FSU 941]
MVFKSLYDTYIPIITAILMRFKGGVKNLSLNGKINEQMNHVKLIHYNIQDIYQDDTNGDYYDETTLPEEDLIKLDEGMTFVYDTLGTDIDLKKEEIREALWNLYYDHDETVVWALDELGKRADKKKKNEKANRKDKKQTQNTEKKAKHDTNQIDESDDIPVDQNIEEMRPYHQVNPTMKEVGYLRLGVRYDEQDEQIDNTAKGKPAINVAVIEILICLVGHHQSGKSTLMGRLLCDLNQIPKSIYDDLNRKKANDMEAEFDYASIISTISEKIYMPESNLIDRCCFETPRYMVFFTEYKDCPNLSNSMKLVADADVLLIIWDASNENTQDDDLIPWDVKRHLDIAKMFGAKKLLFAITKMDSVEWSKKKFNESKDLIEKYLIHFGLGKNDLSITPVSGLTGENLVDDSYLPELRSWYYGPSLAEQINKLRMNQISAELPLSIAFTGHCLDSLKPNTVKIYGVVESGDVSVGEEVIVEPGKKHGRIIEMTGYCNSDESYSLGYRIITIENLRKTDMMQVKAINITFNGSKLCRVATPIRPVQSFVAQLIVGSTKASIVTGSSATLVLGPSIHKVTITNVLEAVEFSTGHRIKNHQGRIGYSNTGKAEIRFSGNPVALDISKNNKITNYISLRTSSGEDLAMGTIIKVIHPNKHVGSILCIN